MEPYVVLFGNLHKNTDEASFQSLIHQSCGTTRFFHLIRYREKDPCYELLSGKVQGLSGVFALAEFENPNALQAALKLHHTPLNGQDIVVHKIQSKHYDDICGLLGIMKLRTKTHAKIVKKIQLVLLLITNLAPEVSGTALFKFFSFAGEPVECAIDRQKSLALIAFKNHEQAQIALACNGASLGSKNITIEYYNPKRHGKELMQMLNIASEGVDVSKIGPQTGYVQISEQLPPTQPNSTKSNDITNYKSLAPPGGWPPNHPNAMQGHSPVAAGQPPQPPQKPYHLKYDPPPMQNHQSNRMSTEPTQQKPVAQLQQPIQHQDPANPKQQYPGHHAPPYPQQQPSGYQAYSKPMQQQQPPQQPPQQQPQPVYQAPSKPKQQSSGHHAPHPQPQHSGYQAGPYSQPQHLGHQAPQLAPKYDYKHQQKPISPYSAPAPVQPQFQPQPQQAHYHPNNPPQVPEGHRCDIPNLQPGPIPGLVPTAKYTVKTERI